MARMSSFRFCFNDRSRCDLGRIIRPKALAFQGYLHIKIVEVGQLSPGLRQAIAFVFGSGLVII